MARNLVFDLQNSTFFYRNDLLEWRRRVLGITLTEIAQHTGIRIDTVSYVFKGKASNKKAYPIAKMLGLDWSQVHNLNLKQHEFHLAILENGVGESHLAKCEGEVSP